MTDREAIVALLHTYAERLDLGDFEGVAALFAHATYGQPGGPVRRGTAEVLAVLRRVVRLHDGIPRTKHVTTNVLVDVDATRGAATARSYFTVLQATPALPLQPVVAGRYHDAFERAAGTWRFTERLIHVDLAGDLREHLLPRG